MSILYTRDWTPATAPRGHVLIVHGYGEHVGRYDTFAEELNGLGLHVHGYDHRGHGQSPGKRGYVVDFAVLVDDLASQLRVLRGLAGDLPIFVFAHSMGGLIAGSYFTGEHTGVSGVIFSSPLLAIPDNVSPLLIRMAGVLGALAPWLPVDRVDSRSISRIPAEVITYDDDPLVYHGAIRARTGSQLTAAIAAIETRFSAITVPFLVIHGNGDLLAPPSGSQRLYEEAGSADKHRFVMDGGYHELLRDEDSDQIRRIVFEQLETWLT